MAFSMCKMSRPLHFVWEESQTSFKVNFTYSWITFTKSIVVLLTFYWWEFTFF